MEVHTLSCYTREEQRQPFTSFVLSGSFAALLYTKLKALKNKRKSESEKALCSFLLLLLLFLPVKEGVVSSPVCKDCL